MRIVISSGHGQKIRGASGYLDEVNEARRVVDEVAKIINATSNNATTFHDNTSTTQSQNLETIVDFHNSQARDLDVSVHFNAYTTTSNPMGTECLYITQSSLATDMSAAIASVGFINRGPKKRTDLYFLNNTNEPAILIEVCFVDSSADAYLYNEEFDSVCLAIAKAIIGEEIEPEEEDEYPTLVSAGKCSWFGGPEDTGVAPDEGLAFIYELDDAPELFLPQQPPGTTGLARRLDPLVYYIAMRWDYDVYPKEMLRSGKYRALVKAEGREFLARPADWGPHQDTGRIADISPGLMSALRISTDDSVEVTFPFTPLVG